MLKQRSEACRRPVAAAVTIIASALMLTGCKAAADAPDGPRRAHGTRASVDAEHEDQTENRLEKALKIGRALPSDYQEFIENGGLNQTRTWHSIPLNQVQPEYGSDGKVTSFFGTVSRTDATIVQIRRSIEEVCHFTQADWQRSEMPGYISASAANQTCDATYLPADDANWAITVGLPGTNSRNSGT